MGGRGASSGRTSTGGNKSGNINNSKGLDYFESKGVPIQHDEIKGLNRVLMDKTLQGVSDTLNEFGLEVSEVTNIGGTDTRGEQAGVNGFNQFSFGRKSYSDASISDFKKDNYTVNSTAYGVGAHEAGHIVTNVALRNYASSKGMSKLERSEMRKSGKFSTQIIKEAKKDAGRLTKISQYGSKTSGSKAGEYVAEAVSDYMTNGKKANPSSVAVVNVLKRYL